MIKNEISIDDFPIYSHKIIDVIQKHDRYFFYFSPDPDAVGTSIAFALFLKNNYPNKDCIIFMPDGYDPNLDFLFKIASFNDIHIMHDVNTVIKHLKKNEYVFTICDTPTYKLLPEFKRLNAIRNSYSDKSAIEIDHHFGGDSTVIFEESATIFYQANSCCEIFADFLKVINQGKGQDINTDDVFPRNIVLSLLVGLCYDTQFGKFIVNEKNYNMWFNFLSDRLKAITWGNAGQLKSAHEVFNAINKMSDVKINTLNKIIENADYKDRAGIVILPYVSKYVSLAENGDSTCIIMKISGDIANMLPEKAGAIGMLVMYDDDKKLYQIKIRRASGYKGYDLREFEKPILEIFGKKFQGGGGHPGATSFRISRMDREKFIEKAKSLFAIIVDIVNKNPV